METLVYLSWRTQQIYECRRSHIRRFLWLSIRFGGVGKFLLEKEKKYLHELLEKWDPEHLEIDEDFNDGLKDNIGDEGILNLEDD